MQIRIAMREYVKKKWERKIKIIERRNLRVSYEQTTITQNTINKIDQKSLLTETWIIWAKKKKKKK